MVIKLDMCRYKYVDYVHVYAECLFQTSTHTERTPARARGGTRRARALADGGQAEAQQELMQQLSCLWFQKSVHL